ncbi:MAG: YfhO family protein [Chloroflexi bacterium]|nr:YfhO family protein [Chloroflexota bacterium]
MTVTRANLMSGIQGLVHKWRTVEWLRDLDVAILLLLVAVFVFHTDLVDGRVFEEADTSTYYYPVMSTLDRAISQNSIPLWTPHIFGGYPLFADGEGGMLYPPNVLLLWLFPVQNAFLLLRVLRYFLASIFFYAFGRTLGIGRHGSLLGGLTFAYGSFMVGQMQHTNVTNSAVWLPMILLLVETALRSSGRKRYLWLLLAGVALAMQSLGVHIQPLLMTLLALSLYVVFRTLIWQAIDAWRAAGGSSPVRAVLAAGRSACANIPLAALVVLLVVAVGFGLAAVQLMPLYELGQTTSRGTSPSYWFASLFALPVPNLIDLIFPYFFVGPDGNGWTLWNLWESTVYAGIAPLALAVLALFFVRRRLVVFFGLLGAVSLYLALGDYLPVKLYSLLWQLPGFHSLRDPGRYTYLFVFSLAVLAAMGMDWLIRTLSTREVRLEKSLAVRLSLFGIAIIVFSGMIVLGQFYLREMLLSDKSSALSLIQSQYLSLRSLGSGLTAERVYGSLLYSLDISNERTLRAILLLCGSGTLLLLWLRFRRLSGVWVALVLAVALVDLTMFAEDFHPRMAISSLSTPSGVARFLVENNGRYRVYNKDYVRAVEPNRLMSWRVSVVGGYSSLGPERNNDFNRAIEHGNLRLLDLWNVRYIVSRGKDPMPAEYKVVYQQDDVTVYENPHILPRAFLVGSAIVAPNGKSVLNKITENGFDPSRAVALEENFEVSLLGEDSGLSNVSTRPVPEPASSSAGEARIEDYSRESVRVRASSPKNAFLVLTDSYYPGWKVYVDGREAKMYHADYLFRGVFLTAGSHEVVFSFEPMSFYAGRAISMTTLLLAVVVLVYCVVPWSWQWRWGRMAHPLRRAPAHCISSSASASVPGTDASAT